jgi:uncharacterized protein YwgA
VNNTLEIPWKRYALIAELAHRLESASPQFGKTVLQKLVYLLQEVFQIDCGYDFTLYSYGPFDSQLLADLDLVNHWGCVTVESCDSVYGGYKIKPTEKWNSVHDKTEGFFDNRNNLQALENLVKDFGSKTAKELELIATTIYVARDVRRNQGTTEASRKVVLDLVQQIKPKFSHEEIEAASDELVRLGHILLAV